MKRTSALSALLDLYEAMLLEHGCFPLDRTNDKQRRINDAMVQASAVLRSYGELA